MALRVACTLPRVVEDALTRVAEDAFLGVIALAERIVLRRCWSSWRAFRMLRDALRVTNERSG